MSDESKNLDWKEKIKRVITNDDGQVIEIEEGSVVDGQFTGKGRISQKYENKTAKILEGRFIDGKLNGKGQAIFIDEHGTERVYDGLFKDGKLVTKKARKVSLREPQVEIQGDVLAGKGFLKNQYGEDVFIQYEGQFRNKKLNGNGKMVLRSIHGLIKERSGHFVDNLLSGQGKVVIENPGGRKFGFEGNFAENVPTGKGKIFVTRSGGQYQEQEGEFQGRNFIPRK